MCYFCFFKQKTAYEMRISDCSSDVCSSDLHLDGNFEANFAFTRSVGEAFLDIFPQLVRRRMDTPFNDEDKRRQLAYRGRYAEFNLVYDRGTLFGLKTGGNVDAILMRDRKSTRLNSSH